MRKTVTSCDKCGEVIRNPKQFSFTDDGITVTMVPEDRYQDLCINCLLNWIIAFASRLMKQNGG
jgi:hypothetical protein